MSEDQIEIIAHRGYSGRAPENTIAAIDAAIEVGADGVEFDVQVAACGTPVLFHDPHLGRTTNGVGPVHRRTFDQLQALDAGGWYAREFEGERIPSLRAALERIGDRTAAVYAEIKAYRELEDLDRMVRIVAETGASDRVRFISLDWATLDRVGSSDSSLPVGLVVERADRLEEAFRKASERSGAFLALSHRIPLEDPEVVERARAQGLPLAVWTVDEVDDANQLAGIGIRRFTTNEVGRLMDWRDRLGSVGPEGDAPRR